MSFWVIAVSLGGLVAVLLGLATYRSRRSSSGDGHDIQVYKDQLSEIGRDLERGVISNAEAKQSQVEVSRRLLEADKARQTTGSGATGAHGSAAGVLVGVLVGAAVLGGAFVLYDRLGAPNYPDLPLVERLQQAEELRLTRPLQAAAEAEAGEMIQAENAEPGHLALIEKLRDALQERPDDLQGHILLAQNEAALGNFVAAHRSQARILEIKGTSATAWDYADYAELLIFAAGGYVSPEAEKILSKALALDPTNGTALYYTGLMLAQTGRADLAFRLWRPLLENAPADAPWVIPITQQIEMVAADAGVKYQLPARTALPGPDAADIAAAGEMEAEERDQMVRSMVARLSERLSGEGGPPEDWARLIVSLGVLGEDQRAGNIWAEAQQVFAGSQRALDTVNDAALRVGLLE